MSILSQNKHKEKKIIRALDKRMILHFEQKGSTYIIYEDIACQYELYGFAIKRLRFIYDFANDELGIGNKGTPSMLMNRLNEMYPNVTAVAYKNCIRFSYFTSVVRINKFPKEFLTAAGAFIKTRESLELLLDQYLNEFPEGQCDYMEDSQYIGKPFDFNREWFAYAFKHRMGPCDQIMKQSLQGWKGDITYANLTPLSESDLYELIAELKTRIKEQIGQEPDRIGFFPYMNSWKEIVKSMEFRNHEAYFVNGKQCERCGGKRPILFHFISNHNSWKELCGREGYMLICPDCLKKLKYYNYVMG